MKTFLKNAVVLTLFVAILALNTGCENKTAKDVTSDIKSGASEIGDDVSSNMEDFESKVDLPENADDSQNRTTDNSQNQ
ncbi:MAG: hypothetical protein II802_00130 [Clostridia bacterium]|nr:hypothetical protein [Clostridia bacterium]